LAWRLQSLDWPRVAPILDRTGLAAAYDFTLESIRRFSTNVTRDSPVVFMVQTMQDQLKSLGLTIEEHTEPTGILVVDHCEKKPVQN
jgi:uncharacterized protein (TIGR03435 family)